MATTADTLILDFDRSVLPLPDSVRIDLAGRQEEIRFGCRLNSLQQLQADIAPALTGPPRLVMMGSGDYHHLTYLLLQRFRDFGQPLQLVVFDNHPDNMRYPWGIHCGSWVWHASRLPFVQQIHVLGITSRDVEAAHGWENHLRALWSGKLRYWCVGRNLDWMRRLGISHSRSFVSTADMLGAFLEYNAASTAPIYLSIDKDVLSAADAHTNWDQGVMRKAEMLDAIRPMLGRIVAADVVGEVSSYRYRSRFKRLLSGLDEQPDIPQENLTAWHTEHLAINLELQQLLAPGRA